MSPKSKQQFEKIRRKSRSAIIQAGLELFSQNGFYNTTIKQIAENAGISKGLVYNYFDSKEALLKCIIIEAVAVLEKNMIKELESSTDPKVQLHNFATSSIDMVKANPHYWKLMTSLSLQTEALRDFEDIFNTKVSQIFGQLEAVFSQMGYENPKVEARLFGAMLDGIAFHFMQLGKDYPLDEIKDFLLKKYPKS